MSEYDRWLENAKDEEVREELLSIKGKDGEIEDRFYRELSFGTGGIRGVIGAGTNRMNVYTVARATFGLAEYLKSIGGDSVVIAYDSRHKSREFARLSAEVLSYNGIKAYLFSELTPTPVLSFAVRYLKASAGIVITASHNPKQYNGYKVYNSLGCQITDAAAAAVTKEIEKFDYFNFFAADDSLIEVLNGEVEDAFISAVKELSYGDEKNEKNVSVVYSPLHGTGRKYVQRILSETGIKEVYTVKEQEMPDGDFTTCPYPNPEEREALGLALLYAEKYKPDLVFATDPDADRIGIAVPNENGEYLLLNGNRTGSILLYYMLIKRRETGKPCQGAAAVKTIVTTDVAFDIAKEFGIEVREVLTGFKYIGEEMEKLDDFVMGMEESYGYLVGKHARDKDAVSAAMMIASACAYFKQKGKSLIDVLNEIDDKYGYYETELKSITFSGKDGMEKMKEIMSDLRQNPIEEIDGQKLTFDDFSNGLYSLPKSDVLRFKNDACRLIIRPSGTEPKIKIYFQAKAKDASSAKSLVSRLKEIIENRINAH